MKLPWDKSYFKLCFYAVFTFIIIYCCKYIIDAAAYGLINAAGVYEGIIGILAYIGSIFSVLIIGFLIAYILEPAAVFLCRKFGFGRKTAAAVVYLCVMLLVVMLTAVFIFELTGGFKLSFTEGFQRIAERSYTNIELFYSGIKNSLIKMRLDFIAKWIEKGMLVKRKTELNLPLVLSRAATAVLGIASGFYMLKDKEEIFKCLNKYASSLLPKRLYCGLLAAAEELNEVFSGYIRGQLTDAIIISLILAVGLMIVKIPFALPIGIISGLFNIIPYFGGIIGFLLAVAAALAGSGAKRAVYTAVLVILVQQIDTMYISPRIIGDKVKLSPLMIIIALTAGSRLFGMAGMFIAVPAAALIKKYLDYLCELKRKKEKLH